MSAAWRAFRLLQADDSMHDVPATDSEVVAALESQLAAMRAELERFGLNPDAPCCPNCQVPMQVTHALGAYRGTTMHRLCALELRVADLETARSAPTITTTTAVGSAWRPTQVNHTEPL